MTTLEKAHRRSHDSTVEHKYYLQPDKRIQSFPAVHACELFEHKFAARIELRVSVN